MILKYDEERHDYIVEDLDDENHLVIKESQLQNLKARLDQVCPISARSLNALSGKAMPRLTHYRIWMRRSCSSKNRRPSNFLPTQRFELEIFLVEPLK